jgi:A/G-specific adenine glycosylase
VWRHSGFWPEAVIYRWRVLVSRSLPPAARDSIIAWYGRHGRRLPFRGTTDPYAVLVSEAMAQQTQAARAGDAWVVFMDRFPTLQALATASTADVLRAWQGLGYNRRAVNLQRAARTILEQHGGLVPADIASLMALPGVGPYTARAVAAIAFGQAVGAVDTNVRRVLGRILAGDTAAPSAAELQRVADATVPGDRAAEWTHAVMDVGATICRPRRPACEACPARPWCAFARGERPGPGDAPVVRPSTPSIAFASTSRWLRGRIVDRLRVAPDGVWTAIEGPIGTHGRASVSAALEALAREGLVELDGARTNGGRARLARLATT